MVAAAEPPSVEQLHRLRAAVKAYADRIGCDEPTAYVSLCASVLLPKGPRARPAVRQPMALTGEDCERLIAKAEAQDG